jgi:EAL domain-containing protein (putative c-di-GMP-specific phosphodiesterase class I)
LRKLMTQLKAAGCSFTFAGFDGSEQSFSFVKSLKPDFVKLSYGIVKNIDHAIADAERAESINLKCHQLGIKTIAEYVESNSVLEHLTGVEVDYAQGLAISPPQAIDMSLPQSNPAPSPP